MCAYRGMQLGPEACLLVMVTRVDIDFQSSVVKLNIKSNFGNPQSSWWGILPLRVSSPFFVPQGSPLEAQNFDGAFANFGSHQIPLLEGVPPRAVVESLDPLQTMKDMLKESFGKDVSSSGEGCCLPWRKVSPVADEDCVDDTTLKLSRTGASAIVRVCDSRLVRLRPEHCALDSSVPIDTKLMTEILSSQPGLNRRLEQFTFDAMKYATEPTVLSQLPVSTEDFFNDLRAKINDTTKTIVQHYIDDIPSFK